MRVYPVQCAWHLGEREIKDYTVDVANEVDSGDSVSNHTWTEEGGSADLTISELPPNGTLCTATISTPTAGVAYNVNVHVVTGVGKEFDIPLLIAGVDKTQ